LAVLVKTLCAGRSKEVAEQSESDRKIDFRKGGR